MRFTIYLFVFFQSINLVFSQDFNDYLPASFHKERRQTMIKQMPKNSVAILFANPERNRANDVDFVYHQDPDFYYLTGLQEPNAVLVLFSEPQTNDKGESYQELLFLQTRDAQKEMWNGKRLGTEGGKNKLGFETAINNTDFASYPLDYKKYNKIMFLNLFPDATDKKFEKTDLADLISAFKQNSSYPANYSASKYQIYDKIKNAKPEEKEGLKNQVKFWLTNDPDMKNDQILEAFVNPSTKPEQLASMSLDFQFDGYSLNNILKGMREIKSKEELVLLRKVADISAVAQIEAWKAIKPGMSEMEVQGIHEFVYRKYGAEFQGYPSIVGAGGNGCILHYNTNTKLSLGNDLVLMDVGAEYRNFSADVTRTVPANGKFTKEQKLIYDIVFNAQEKTIALCKPGTSWAQLNEMAKKLVNEGLKNLGIIDSIGQKHTYYPHGVGHHLGLDVHDKSNYGPLQANMVLTIEPGIYIPENSPCDKKWWGIGVRIEDDILVTNTTPEVISARAPRTTAEIEAIMAQPSPFENYALPVLKDGK